LNEQELEATMPYGAQGRPVSWIAVGVIILGFMVGGVGLVAGPMWWLFWVGVAITVGGGIFAWAIDIMEDYDTAAH
jgi:ABC-type transport system involved in cytochrome c biogenesis permease subunit